jgi:hypothetical protein
MLRHGHAHKLKDKLHLRGGRAGTIDQQNSLSFVFDEMDAVIHGIGRSEDRVIEN